GLLPDRLVVEDHARDVAHAFGGAEHNVAIVATVVLGAFGVDGVEGLLDGGGGLVSGKDALAGRGHGFGDFVEVCEIHSPSPGSLGIRILAFPAGPGVTPFGVIFASKPRPLATVCPPSIPGRRRRLWTHM